ncbi:hypothetical protein FSP39_023786 [Pinctada imbricata]|uniref:G-protein coupled receptors family 1 profile domain-containing protein n=1 Tax=Pinctada imbricata TaxID=66713 RepID=A0AA89BU92_PINIB|nr:hypothetical protein FSP39_023786 [Pinctada imbricata]
MDHEKIIYDLAKEMDEMPNDTLIDLLESTSNKTRSYDKLERQIVLPLSFGLLVILSLFSNTLVCHVIFKKKKMMTVTNIFIANMAFSDILLVLINVPLNIARHIMDEWIFGPFLCHLLNFSLMISVYVSTFTLTAIALDRQRVLLYPLHPRITKRTAFMILILIWSFSAVFSLPYALFTRVDQVHFLHTSVKRCRTNGFPQPNFIWEQSMTVATFLVQYVLPLVTITVTYSRIVHRLWVRTHLGVVTETQLVLQIQNKRKSIKLLVAVVVVFAVCWMPLNLYHLLTDLYPDPTVFPYDTNAFFVCQWIAISSACINPILYCYINPSFRAEVKSRFSCCSSRSETPHVSEMEMDDLLTRETLPRNRRYTLNSSSTDARRLENNHVKDYAYKFVSSQQNGHIHV